MKISKKEMVISHIEGLLWLAGLCCVGVFIYVQFNAVQATQKAVAQFGDKTEVAEISQKSAKQESFEGYLENFTPSKSDWSQARLDAYAKLEQDNTQLDSIGLLNIPMLNIQAAVFNNTSDEALDLGIGRVKGTSYFGLPGNVAIAGHRDGFFRNLKDISKGDDIVVRYQYGKINYRVDSMQVVEPTDVSILQDTDDSTITLITCYPFDFIGSAPQRFIVRATRVNKTLSKEQIPNSIQYANKEKQ